MQAKSKLLITYLGGFLIPPIMWNLAMYYSEVISAEEMRALIFRPRHLIFALVYLFLAYNYFNSKLNLINNFMEGNEKKNINIEGVIKSLPRMYIFLMIVFCVVGPNLSMMGLEFISRQKYLFGLFLSLPIFFLFSVPLIILSVIRLEQMCADISQKDIMMSFTGKIYIAFGFTFLGIISFLILLNLGIMFQGSQTVNFNFADQIVRKNLGTGFLVFVIGLINLFLLTSQLTSPVKKVMNRLKEISQGRGDLTKEIEIDSRDEMGKLAGYFNQFLSNMRDMVQDIQKVSSELSASSQELSASGEEVSASADEVGNAVQEVASGAEEQSAQAEETKSSMDELVEEVDVVNSSIQEMNRKGVSVLEDLDRGSNAIDQSVEQLEMVENNSRETAGTIDSLNDSSEKISDIVETIGNIANQTNLLALNASIEAARAGEAGRGFSVVAEEIRELAENTEKATGEIADLINSIQNKVKRTVNDMNETQDAIENNSEYMQKSDEIFNSVENEVRNFIDILKDMSSRAAEVNEKSSEVVEIISQVAKISNESAGNAQEVAASSEEQSASTERIVESAENLSEMAKSLEEVVNQFNI